MVNRDSHPLKRTAVFCDRFGLRLPILLAPMAGACPPSTSIAVMRAGGMGACGALLMQPKEIEDWADEVRANAEGPFQINLWIPDPPPIRDRSHEAKVREFLASGHCRIRVGCQKGSKPVGLGLRNDLSECGHTRPDSSSRTSTRCFEIYYRSQAPTVR